MSTNKKIAKKYYRSRNSKKGKESTSERRDLTDQSKDRYDADQAKLSAKGRNNNPNWYFTDQELAKQGSYLSFQQIAGLPFRSGRVSGISYDYPTIRVRHLNPSPGVQIGGSYSSSEPQKSAINLAGFKLFSKLSAYTGRKADYGPQDISTMILFMGEVISMVEFIRRVFGVAFTYSMRNRIYPKGVIEAMQVNSDDLMSNFSDYRMRFNAAITRLNQVPIPKNVAYFDKCATLYEKMYLDSESSMATCLFDVPATTWKLNEALSDNGTVLETEEWTFNPSTGATAIHSLAWYLIALEYRIDELLESSTFQIVYTDLLNLATKMQTDFWKFDYLSEGYMVMPEYNQNYLLQMHNEIITGSPRVTALDTNHGVTPSNDVWPNADKNSLFYNPGFAQYQFGLESIIDTITPDPDVEDRIELSRFISLSSGTRYIDPNGSEWTIDTVLPDHYVLAVTYYSPTQHFLLGASYIPSSSITLRIASMKSKVDWDSFVYAIDGSTHEPTGSVIGDFNFFTLIDYPYLRRLNDMIGMALYDLR